MPLFNPEHIKNDFPIFANNPGLVYLDSAASAQRPRQVLDAMRAYHEEYNANIHRGIYRLSERATAAYETAREKIAKFIDARESAEIIFTHNATESINLVASSWGRTNLREGDEILTSQMEHHANIVPWQMLTQQLTTGQLTTYNKYKFSLPVKGDKNKRRFHS